MIVTTSIDASSAAATAPRASNTLAFTRLALVGIGVAEAAALGFRVAAGGQVLFGVVAIQMAALVALATLVFLDRRHRRDATYSVLGLIAGAAIGPLGPLGACLLSLASRDSAGQTPLIAQWYERIALSITVPAEERICEDVAVGRTLDPSAPAPMSFPDAMTTGSLADRQAILGHIARHFDPAYLATLKIALASPEAVIRVQAAAVAAHIAPRVQGFFGERMAAVEEGRSDPVVALALLDDLEALSESGLLDETDRQRCAGEAARLGDTVLASIGRRPLALPWATDVATAARLAQRFEKLLIARSRFADLRAHRTDRRVHARHPKARLKRLGGSQVTAGATS